MKTNFSENIDEIQSPLIYPFLGSHVGSTGTTSARLGRGLGEAWERLGRGLDEQQIFWYACWKKLVTLQILVFMMWSKPNKCSMGSKETCLRNKMIWLDSTFLSYNVFPNMHTKNIQRFPARPSSVQPSPTASNRSYHQQKCINQRFMQSTCSLFCVVYFLKRTTRNVHFSKISI